MIRSGPLKIGITGTDHIRVNTPTNNALQPYGDQVVACLPNLPSSFHLSLCSRVAAGTVTVEVAHALQCQHVQAQLGEPAVPASVASMSICTSRDPLSPDPNSG